MRKARKLLGMTQQDLADALGVTVKNIDSWESDRNRPRDLVDIATRVEDLAGVDRGWMLGFFDSPVTRGYSDDERPAQLPLWGDDPRPLLPHPRPAFLADFYDYALGLTA